MSASFRDVKANDFRTICEVHREMYDILILEMEKSPARDEIEKRLEESYIMAKKMDAKLKQYKLGYDDGWWEEQNAELKAQKISLRRERNRKL